MCSDAVSLCKFVLPPRLCFAGALRSPGLGVGVVGIVRRSRELQREVALLAGLSGLQSLLYPTDRLQP